MLQIKTSLEKAGNHLAFPFERLEMTVLRAIPLIAILTIASAAQALPAGIKSALDKEHIGLLDRRP